MILKLREKLGESVKEGEALARHTNFRIGGPADYFYEARTSEDIVRAVESANELGIDFFIFGGGSNILVSDAGFRGLTIKAANRSFVIPDDSKVIGARDSSASYQNDGKITVYAEAGVLSALLARKTAEAGLAGFEWAISLPGTIGGAVCGNAGCFGGEMKDVVSKIKLLSLKNSALYHSPELYKGDIVELSNQECKFGYRDSVFKHMEPSPVILSAELELQSDDPERCLARVSANLSLRKEKQPLESSSAGCLFKNFEFKDADAIKKIDPNGSLPKEFIRAKRIPASWIIEQLGLKGYRIGDAKISEKHGNFVLNLGAAKADHVIQLIAFVKTRARNTFGVQLQEEVQFVGF